MTAEEEGSERRAIEIGMFFIISSDRMGKTINSAAVVDGDVLSRIVDFQGHIRC